MTTIDYIISALIYMGVMIIALCIQASYTAYRLHKFIHRYEKDLDVNMKDERSRQRVKRYSKIFGKAERNNQ